MGFLQVLLFFSPCIGVLAGLLVIKYKLGKRIQQMNEHYKEGNMTYEDHQLRRALLKRDDKRVQE